MSAGSLSWAAIARSWREEQRQRWQQASPQTRTRVQLAVLVAAVLVAFHYSLRTLLQDLNMDTPLAYVGLVPGIALALAAGLNEPSRPEPPIHDRQLDYIVGLPLIAASMIINLVVPSHLDDLFWIWRLDLVTLPLFVAGAVALLFGVRALWRQKLAVVYLFLAWPLPYTVVLLHVLDWFTNMTVGALTAAVGVIPVASPVSGSPGEFSIMHDGHAFPLSVVSACSGVNGVVGFLLVGVAFAALVTGPRVRKALWLVGGMAVLWTTNLLRVLFIFWAGRMWGEHAAIQILHPFVGLVTFSLGVLAMLAALRPIGLRLRWDLTHPTPRPASPPRAIAVPAILPAVSLLALAALLIGVTNGHLKQYNLVADSAGEPKLASYTLDPAAPTGWTAAYQTSYTWAKPYFGDNSTWYRFLYSPTSATPAGLYSSLPVTADVVNSTNLNSFSAYGVTACYKFHGYTLRDIANMGLGGGIKGQALSYSTSSHGDWSIVWWIWPVKSSGATHYERVILYLQDTPQTTVHVPGVITGIKSLQGALDPHNQYDARLIAERSFLVAFARQVVAAQAHIQPGTQLPGLAAAVGTQDRQPGPMTNAQMLARAKRLGYLPANPARR